MEPIRKLDEEKRKIVLQASLERLWITAQAKAVVGEEEQNGVIQITLLLHSLEEVKRWLVRHFDPVDVRVSPLARPHPREYEIWNGGKGVEKV